MTPSVRNSRIRTSLSRMFRACAIVRYERAHCCDKIANRADARLMTKLRNQSELTQMADAVGENASGSGNVVGGDL